MHDPVIIRVLVDIDLQMTKEKASDSGHYLEKFLGVKYRGGSQYLNCTRLRVLQLGRNGLKGNLPSAIAMCKHLTRLELHENALEGKMPEEVAESLPNLLVLRLNNNALTGELPHKWATSLLELLDVSYNQFTGSLPKAVVGMSKLHTINISHGRFNERLPDGDELWNCTGLRIFRVDHNRLRGELPRSLFQKCHALEEVIVSNNTLSGLLPRTVRNCTRLRELDCHTNFFQGSVPCYQLKECKSLKLINFLYQHGEDALAVKTDDGSKADLLATLTDCDIMWPGDEHEPSARAISDQNVSSLIIAKERCERQRENAFRSWKESEETAKKADDNIAQLEIHFNQVKIKAEAARFAQRAAAEAFIQARDKEAEAKTALTKMTEALVCA